MKRVNQCNTRLAKEKKRTQGTRVKSCAKKIQLAELQLQKDPTNVEVREILLDAQGKLAKFSKPLWHATGTSPQPTGSGTATPAPKPFSISIK
jgi:hypothetical protein